MAASSFSPSVKELPSKPVQELRRSIGDQVPERYIFVQNKEQDSEASQGYVVPWMDNNIVDLQLLSDPSSPQSEEELRKLRSYLSSWGCFQLINHGLTKSVDQVREISKQFFALSLEEKQKYSRTLDSFEGYGNDSVSKDMPMHWNDRLHLKVYPLDQQNLKFWPENVPKFRETLNVYTNEVSTVLQVILKATARSLNLEENSFCSQCADQDCVMMARFNYYPSCPSPERVLGLKPHSDGSSVTILLQDEEVEGLQVQKDNEWYKVPIVPNALFINIGDQLEIMSNGALKSPVHKVVVDKARERSSMAVFCSTHPNKEIGPLSELIDDERPRLYKTTNASAYFQYYGRGVRFIDAMKL